MRIDPRSRLTVALLALAAATMVVPALSGASPGKAKVKVEATLKGKDEVPGPGDANGKGEIVVVLNKAKKKVCFDLVYEKLDGASAGHIHKGKEGEAGPIKVELFNANPELPGGATVEDCVRAKKTLIRKIGKRPENFYVNVHNTTYPDGAIRGQLSRVPAAG